VPHPIQRLVPAGAALAGALALVTALALWQSDTAVPDRAAPPRALAAIAGPLQYRLDDGTRIELAHGAHGSVAWHGPASGTRFVLTRGRASFDVVPQRAPFSVVAGDREVSVLGTRFSVSYEPGERVVVAVEHGAVSVRGPNTAVTRLGAGQRFDSHAASAPRASEATAAPAAAASTPTKPSVASIPTWRELYLRREYAAALSAARHAGFERLAATLGAVELADLADTARLAGDAAAALTVLHALERRFPDTSQARQARFLIGRVLLQTGNAAGAVSAFERYLQANPSGTYSTEAMGRLVELYNQRGDSARARDMARRYLARAPHGPYQRLARSLISEP
jgi:TolA-binding protein